MPGIARFSLVALDTTDPVPLARLYAIGARKAGAQPGQSFRVFLDPAGHPFCLVRA